MPKSETMKKSQSTGAVMAAMTNSRNVRPRDMRARNSPTKGPQASQNAQKKSVHPAIHSAPPGSYAKVCSVRSGRVKMKRPMFSTMALSRNEVLPVTRMYSIMARQPRG